MKSVCPYENRIAWYLFVLTAPLGRPCIPLCCPCRVPLLAPRSLHVPWILLGHRHVPDLHCHVLQDDPRLSGYPVKENGLEHDLETSIARENSGHRHSNGPLDCRH